MPLCISRIAGRAIVFAVLFVSLQSLASPAPRPLPSIAVINLDGKPLRLEDLAVRPAVVNIWATWCPPCRNEMASLQQLSAKIKQDGISVVALSVDADHNLVREFVLKYGIKIPTPIATMPRQALSALDVSALPVTLYVDAEGRIVGRHIGQRDWADEAAARDIRQTLSNPRPALR